MKKRFISAFAAVALIATSGAAAGTVQAVTSVPLSPVGHLPLTPVSQQSAIRAAQGYLDVAGLSRQGLIDQLVSIDGFSTADATYAVNSITVDWNTQAARAAQSYLDVAGLSRSGMIEQLTSIDQFTPTQAAYGATAVGL